jgi:hypothetical protein
MSYVISQVGVALKDALLMAWQVWWALVLGFAISAIVQAWVPRHRIESALAGDGPRPLLWATGLGAASSSCSYAAVALARSLFVRGASFVAAMVFEISISFHGNGDANRYAVVRASTMASRDPRRGPFGIPCSEN